MSTNDKQPKRAFLRSPLGLLLQLSLIFVAYFLLLAMAADLLNSGESAAESWSKPPLVSPVSERGN